MKGGWSIPKLQLKRLPSKEVQVLTEAIFIEYFYEASFRAGTIFTIDRWHFEDYPFLASLRALDGSAYEG